MPRGERRSIDARVEHGIDRFVMTSAYGATEPLAEPGAIRPYPVAKRRAEDYLERSPLDATILRPTTLTDDEGTGRVSATFEDRGGDGDGIPRADVARTVVARLANEETVGQTIGLFGGDTRIENAIKPDR